MAGNHSWHGSIPGPAYAEPLSGRTVDNNSVTSRCDARKSYGLEDSKYDLKNPRNVRGDADFTAFGECADRSRNGQPSLTDLSEKTKGKMVGARGFEPPASWSRTRRASQAALRPDDTHSAALENGPNGTFRIA